MSQSVACEQLISSFLRCCMYRENYTRVLYIKLYIISINSFVLSKNTICGLSEATLYTNRFKSLKH